MRSSRPAPVLVACSGDMNSNNFRISVCEHAIRYSQHSLVIHTSMHPELCYVRCQERYWRQCRTANSKYFLASRRPHSLTQSSANPLTIWKPNLANSIELDVHVFQMLLQGTMADSTTSILHRQTSSHATYITNSLKSISPDLSTSKMVNMRFPKGERFSVLKNLKNSSNEMEPLPARASTAGVSTTGEEKEYSFTVCVNLAEKPVELANGQQIDCDDHNHNGQRSFTRVFSTGTGGMAGHSSAYCSNAQIL